MSNNAVKSFTFSVAIHTAAALGWFFLHSDDKEVEKKELTVLSVGSFEKESLRENTPMQEPIRQEEALKKSNVKPKEPQEFAKQQKDVWSHDSKAESSTRANERNTNNTPQIATNIQEQKVGAPEPKIDETREYVGLNSSKIRELIAKHKRYPSQAVKMGIEGVCHISFRLNPNGEADNIRVVKSSSFSSLDKSSIQTIEDAAIYMPKPQKSVTLVVPIEYHLN